jgi:hypothetical protein
MIRVTPKTVRGSHLFQTMLADHAADVRGRLRGSVDAGSDGLALLPASRGKLSRGSDRNRLNPHLCRGVSNEFAPCLFPNADAAFGHTAMYVVTWLNIKVPACEVELVMPRCASMSRRDE